MSGRVRADEAVRVKGSNPSWLDRDRETRDGRAAEVATKVSRHRAGVLPGWAAGAEADEDDGGDDARNDVVPVAVVSSAHPGRRRVAAPAVIISGAREVKPPTFVRGSREPAGSEDESTASEEEEDEDDTARRRAAARARLAARRADEEEGMPVGEEDDDEDFPAAEKSKISPRPEKPDASEDEGSSSWETDTDASDSDDDARKMVRPVFVSRAKRETLRARDGATNADAETNDEWAAAEAHRKKRAEESRRLLELELERETAIANAEANAEASDVDTDDDVEDPAVAYQAWRLRELARIEEDERVRDDMFAEREAQEKIRRMSEAEKKAYFDAHPELRKETPEGEEGDAGPSSRKQKPKLGFMQKYYHKGAFFQEAADDAFGTAATHEIYARDFSAATGGDRGVDKSSLPKAMQVRGDKFGKVGQTKWTHLANEDTSRLATERPQHRRAGKEQSFEKPSRRT